MIKIENLNKSFRSKEVLRDISVEFENRTYALLGENGAGKTTLIRCITGMYPYKGIITITGNGEIGYMPQSFGAFKELTVREMLYFFANQKGLKPRQYKKEVENLIELVNLAEKADVKTAKLSGGMQKRLGIAQALLGNPEILILDEPTSGLDPEERLRFKNIIQKIKGGKTIILSTHIVEDVETVCDDVVILDGGQIKSCCSTEKVKDIAAGKVFEVPEESLKETKGIFIMRRFQKGDEVVCRILSSNFDAKYAAEPTTEDGYLCSIKNL